MNRFSSILMCATALAAGASIPAMPEGYLVQTQSIALPDVSGRIDHMGFDTDGQRLFVAALGAGSVEVIDAKRGSVLRRITGLEEPQGVFFSRALDRLYVTNAGSGACDVFDGNSFAKVGRFDLGGDADNVHEDAKGMLLVSAGDTLMALDPTGGLPTIVTSLPGHPEGFAVEREGNRIFMNVPLPSRRVFVYDRSTRTTTSWPLGSLLGNAFSNFPMSLDETDGRLFVATREPPALHVLDSSTGKVVAEAAIDGDADDIFYDTTRARVYVSCGRGFVDVFQRVGKDRYRELERVPTAPGARTSLWEPTRSRLFLAVPRSGGHPAEVRVYEAGR